MTDINEKISRFIELSFEFTKSESDLFDKEILIENIIYNTTSINYGTGTTKGYGIITPGFEGKTKAERIKNKLKIENDKLVSEMQKAERYDEFISLRENLATYFKSLEKTN